jgi:hypothetical protein
MGQLQQRVETISGEFKSQEVANTPWAIGFFCIQFNFLFGFLSLSVASVFHLVRHDRWPACGFFCQCTEHERETRVIV